MNLIIPAWLNAPFPGLSLFLASDFLDALHFPFHYVLKMFHLEDT